MKTQIHTWKVQELLDALPTILEQPKYQRGAVWNPLKRQMLIDSMLRGIDIPKLYLRLVNRGVHKYEVADGQQRIIAIREFSQSSFGLSGRTVNGLDLSKVSHFNVVDKEFGDLNPKLKKLFLNYRLTIAVVEGASNAEIRVLFGRLQMGDTLNPAEKRNAIISQLGVEVDNLTFNHDFMKHCKVAEARFKRQDYVTHAIALLYYKNTLDLKAPLFAKMYFDLANKTPKTIIKDVVRILNWMHQIDINSKRRIVNKWSFIDIFFVLYTSKDRISSIDYSGFGNTFTDFELLRIRNSTNPEKLISGKVPTELEENLYQYIVAFKANGGNPTNIKKRLKAFQYVFKSNLTLK